MITILLSQCGVMEHAYIPRYMLCYAWYLYGTNELDMLVGSVCFGSSLLFGNLDTIPFLRRQLQGIILRANIRTVRGRWVCRQTESMQEQRVDIGRVGR